MSSGGFRSRGQPSGPASLETVSGVYQALVWLDPYGALARAQTRHLQSSRAVCAGRGTNQLAPAQPAHCQAPAGLGVAGGHRGGAPAPRPPPKASPCLVAGPSRRCAVQHRTGPGSKVSSVAVSGNTHTSIIPFYPDSWPPAPLTLTMMTTAMFWLSARGVKLCE